MKRVLLGMAIAAALAGCASGGMNTGRGYGAYGYGAADSERTLPADQGISPAALSPEQVRLVQRSLAERGLVVNVSGTFDDRTHSALLEFQKAQSLPENGVLDDATLRALGIDPRDVTPVRGPADVPNVDVERVHTEGG